MFKNFIFQPEARVPLRNGNSNYSEEFSFLPSDVQALGGS